ncbi:MAG: ribosome small subunit-dependent GTPase A, partial [Clostridia bacterium]|nr:ribosome small subunit-dependent GTPase A [Clostridia bacterium]
FDDSVEKIKTQIKGVCVLAGQSAVGKSSIINALKKQEVAVVGDFCKKIERGKQTTRTVSLFEFGKGKYLADTAGFSKLDETLLDLDPEEVKKYFYDFLKYSEDCKYKSCDHLQEKDCGVVKAVKNGKIDKTRYENYLKLYNTIKSLKRF